MEIDPEYLVFAIVLFALFQVGTAATGVEMPGTIELDDPFQGIGSGGDSDATRCTLETKVGVSGKLTGAAINKDAFRIHDIRPSGFLGSAIAGSGPMSFLGTTDVEMKFTLNGPIDQSITTTKQVGDGSLGSTEEATIGFKATNLPPGQYSLHHNLYHAKGSDYLRADIIIQEGCSASLNTVER